MTEIKLDDDAIYSLPLAAKAVGLSRETLSRAVRNGQLVGARRERYLYFTGANLRAWLLVTAFKKC